MNGIVPPVSVRV